MNALQAPFPFFGGKRRAAADVWRMLGDPGGYVEPFAGSAAVLLARPHTRSRRTETLNDADGWLVNTWRAIQLAPADVARHAAGPLTEIDYHARLAWLTERRADGLVSWLEGDPEAHDAKAAGWWLYVMAAGIGDPFGSGPWRVVNGRLVDTRTTGTRSRDGINRKLPHLANAGRGIHRELPHLGSAGQGVNADRYGGGGGLDVHRHGIEAAMRALSDRLAHVRITAGDWRRVLTPAVHRAGTGGDGARAVFLDPPYATSGDLYVTSRVEGATIAADVRAWCLQAPADLRIILCGYEDEHDELLAHGWTVHQGTAGGRGYNTDPDASRRERMWASPACLTYSQDEILNLLTTEETP